MGVCQSLVISSHSTRVFSLFPLCVKDGAVIAFFALAVFYYVWLVDVHNFAAVRPLRDWKCNWSVVDLLVRGLIRAIKRRPIDGVRSFGRRLQTVSSHASVVGGLGLCALSLIVPPPKKLPDLFPLLNAVYCCAHFLLFLLYFNYRMLFDGNVPMGSTQARRKQKTQ